MAEVVAWMFWPSCGLADGSHGGSHFLAAGSHGGSPFLAAGPVAGRRLHLLPVGPLGAAATPTYFVSPAGFCSLEWANSTETTCWRSGFGSGIIAGGLENGGVAIWNPRTKLGDLNLPDSPVISEYITLKPSLPFNCFTPNLKAVSSGSGKTNSDAVKGLDSEYNVAVEEGEFEVKFLPGWAESKLKEDHMAVDDFQKPSLHYNDPADAAPDMLSLLCNSSGPVRSLSFSPMEPDFLSSGCENAISVWDLTEPSVESIPTIQRLGFGSLSHQHSDTSFDERWRRIFTLVNSSVKQGLSHHLGAWTLWRHHNDCVFNGASRS